METDGPTFLLHMVSLDSRQRDARHPMKGKLFRPPAMTPLLRLAGGFLRTVSRRHQAPDASDSSQLIGCAPRGVNSLAYHRPDISKLAGFGRLPPAPCLPCCLFFARPQRCYFVPLHNRWGVSWKSHWNMFWIAPILRTYPICASLEPCLLLPHSNRKEFVILPHGKRPRNHHAEHTNFTHKLRKPSWCFNNFPLCPLHIIPAFYCFSEIVPAAWITLCCFQI